MQTSERSAGEPVRSPASDAPSGTPSRSPQPRDGSTPISALADAYMASYAGRDTTRVHRLGWWVGRVGHVAVHDLTDDNVFEGLEALQGQRGRYFAGKDADGQAIMKAKRKPLAPATINRYHAALSALLTWAQRRRYTPKGWNNPCRHVELQPERNAIVRFLSDAEREALLVACRASTWPKLYVLVLMALTTGARRGELLQLRWRDVDLQRAEATVHQSKNGDKKVLPLTDAVVTELGTLVGAPGVLLFASTRRPDVPFNFDPAWDLALRTTGVKAFRFHDLRHSCASYLAQAGAPLLEIAEVLGHRQLSVTRRYAHLTTKHKAALVTRVLGDIR